MSDLDYLKVGVSRCMSAAKSGNDFLQSYRKEDQSCVRVSNFFEALKSPRRLANLASVNQMLRPYLLDHLADELAVIEELKGWHLYAGDGHYHKGAILIHRLRLTVRIARRANPRSGISSGSTCVPIISATSTWLSRMTAKRASMT